MAEIHTATSSPFIKALVAAVLEFVDEFKPIMYGDSEAGQAVLYDLRTQMDDDLQIKLASVIAEWQLSQEEET